MTAYLRSIYTGNVLFYIFQYGAMDFNETLIPLMAFRVTPEPIVIVLAEIREMELFSLQWRMGSLQ